LDNLDQHGELIDKEANARNIVKTQGLLKQSPMLEAEIIARNQSFASVGWPPHRRHPIIYKRAAHPSELNTFPPQLNFRTKCPYYKEKNLLKLLRIRFIIHFHILLTRTRVMSYLTAGAAVSRRPVFVSSSPPGNDLRSCSPLVLLVDRFGNLPQVGTDFARIRKLVCPVGMYCTGNVGINIWRVSNIPEGTKRLW
jgi:hypothetical protein